MFNFFKYYLFILFIIDYCWNGVDLFLLKKKLIESSRRVILLLHGGIQIYIDDDVLYSCKSQINLLSFKNIRRNGYHIETTNEKILNIWKTMHIEDKLHMFFLWLVLHVY